MRAPAFLASVAFRGSTVGSEFSAREKEFDGALRRAEAKLLAMTGQERPPNPYRSQGACPFECCTYRQWKTKTVIQLRESIDSARVVAEVSAGSWIQAITGDVYVEPEPYAALESHGRLNAGDVIFFLDNRGEGFVNYWHDGKLNPDVGL